MIQRSLLQSWLDEFRPDSILDLGCNTGRYSRMAARFGRVVALDSDVECIENLYRIADREKLDILPLVADLGRPSPALGWDNDEESSLLDRIEGRFQLVMALALVHHLLVRERIPLDDIVDFLARCTTRSAIVEWVSPIDPQFQRLSGPNASLYGHLRQDDWERALSRRFQIQRKTELIPGKRWIYGLLKLGRRAGKDGRSFEWDLLRWATERKLSC